MSICNRGDPDFDGQACAAAGGTPYGEGADDKPQFREIDGVTYQVDPATGELNPAKVNKPKPDLTPILDALRAAGGITPSEMSASGVPYYVRDPSMDDTFTGANGKMFSTNDSMNALLKLSGMNDSGGGDGSGVGWANLAQRQEEFAYEREQDKVALAINILKTLADEAQAADQRAQYGQQNRLEALKYMIDPNQQFIPGFEPGAYNTRMGLTTALAVPHTRFNPDLPPNPYTGQVSSGLARLQALAG